MQSQSQKWQTGIGALLGAVLFGAVFFAFSFYAEASTGNAICRAYGLVCDRVQSGENGGAIPVVNCESELNGMQQNEDVAFVKCLGNYDGQSPGRVSAPDIGDCGNGVIDNGEQCDLGVQNNVTCTPGYDQTCQYCSNQCQTITVNPTAYCGNGVLDIEGGETCDVIGGLVTQGIVNTDFITQEGNPIGDGRTRIIACPTLADVVDRYEEDQTFGQLKCNDTCQFNFNASCSSCGLVNGPGAIPHARIVNPMAGMDFDGYQTWLQELRPKFMMRTDNVWNRDVFNFGEPAPFQQNGEMQLLGQDVVDADKRLITAQQCSDRYAVFFNERQISDIFDAKDGTSGDDYYGVGALYRGVGSSSGQTGIETLEPNPNPNGRRPPLLGPFDYSVNGEGRILSHDLVLSPAIPPGQFRIVVTWTTAEQERGLTFPLLSYYSGAGPVWDDSVSRLTSALGNRTICDDMRRFVDPASGVSEGYWHPAGDTCDMVNGTFVHRANHGNVIRTQSQTINTLSNQIEENTAFGIFVGVGARGVDNAQPPIQQYLDADVTVEVYRYFPGQVPEHSLYPPIATFHLSDAEISGNSSAKYWHVFNLIKRGAGDDVAFDIEQVRQWLPTDEGDGDLSEPYSSGMIATDFDKIKDNMHASLTGNGISPILARMLEEQYGGNNVMSNIQRALQRGGGWANNLQVELDEDALLGEINANGFGGIWGGPEAEFADDGDDAPAALPEEARNRGRVDVPPR